MLPSCKKATKKVNIWSSNVWYLYKDTKWRPQQMQITSHLVTSCPLVPALPASGGSEEAPSARPAKFVNTFSGKPCADAVRLQEAQTTRDTNTAASSTTNCRITDWTCSHALTLWTVVAGTPDVDGTSSWRHLRAEGFRVHSTCCQAVRVDLLQGQGRILWGGWERTTSAGRLRIASPDTTNRNQSQDSWRHVRISWMLRW